MSIVLHYFPDAEGPALQLAKALRIPARPITLRSFPEGESLVRVAEAGTRALLFRTLNDPNTKLVELFLAAAALRDGGAQHITLIAPYLGYMRQDMAFSPGEAVSQRVVGELLANAFDALVTVDPHLHRTPSLDLVMPGRQTVNVSAAPALAAALAAHITPDTLLVGPDSESRPWVAAIAAPLGLDMLVGEKHRHGDREVTLHIPGSARAAGRPVVLVDDMISSGGTLIACADALRSAGAGPISAAVTHCLSGPNDLARLAAAGIAPLLATDSVPGPAAKIPLAEVLAAAILQHGLAEEPQS
jgi:ribose-phosphate pyrophosphokinase